MLTTTPLSIKHSGRVFLCGMRAETGTAVPRPLCSEPCPRE
jgi:hypothetical protein